MIARPPPPNLDPATRAALEALYGALCSAVVMLAKALGHENPLRSREERRAGKVNKL